LLVFLFGLVEEVVHVSHQEADGFDRDRRPALFGLRDSFFHLLHLLDSGKDLELLLRTDLHCAGRELGTLGQDPGDVLSKHVLVDKFGENASVVNSDAADVFVSFCDPVNEVVRHQEDHDHEKHYQNLDLVFFFLQEVRQGDADCHGALAVGVAVLEEVVSGFLVGHNLDKRVRGGRQLTVYALVI